MERAGQYERHQSDRRLHTTDGRKKVDRKSRIKSAFLIRKVRRISKLLKFASTRSQKLIIKASSNYDGHVYTLLMFSSLWTKFCHLTGYIIQTSFQHPFCIKYRTFIIHSTILNCHRYILRNFSPKHNSIYSSQRSTYLEICQLEILYVTAQIPDRLPRNASLIWFSRHHTKLSLKT